MSAAEGEPPRDPAAWFASRSPKERRALRRAVLRGRETRDRQTAATLAWLARREAWRSLWTTPLTMLGVTLFLVVALPGGDGTFIWGYALGWALGSLFIHARLRRSHRRFTDERGDLPPWTLVAVSFAATYLLPVLVVRLLEPPDTAARNTAAPAAATDVSALDASPQGRVIDRNVRG